jgi:hypothetical protein
MTLREEHKLGVVDNRVLRRICGPKKDETTGEWRKLHNEELRIFYSLPSISRMLKSKSKTCAAHVARMEERRSIYIYYIIGKTRRKETTRITKR